MLQKHDVQFHYFLKKGKKFHLDLKVEDNLQKIEENYFQKNEENHDCLNLTSIKRIKEN